MKKISIVIPAYNAGQWLPRCLDSLLAQTYEEIEIIVVDDGSTDNTEEVLADYMAKNENIRVIHQQRGGVTRARLKGVEAATGTWIGFVDADDAVVPDMYRKLMDNAFAYDADITHCGFQIIYPDGRVEYAHNTGVRYVQDHLTGLRDLLEEKLVEPGLWNKLFRKPLFAGLEDRMDFSIRNNEDMLMNYYLFEKAERSIFEDFCPYQYLIRRGSASRSKLNANIIYDPIRVRQIILDNCSPEMKKDARAALARMCLVSYRLIVMEDREEYAQDRRAVRQLIRQQLPHLSDLPLRNALLVVMISKTPWFFDILYPIYERMFR